MFERIRLGSAAALAVSLTMVGSGIYTATQDSGDDTTVDLASSVGSRTPTAAPTNAAADGEARSLAFVEAPAAATEGDPPPGRRPPAPTAYPRVTVKQTPPPRTRQAEPSNRCYGYAKNSINSTSNVVAETTTGVEHLLGRGEEFAGTAAEQVIGFHIPTPDRHVEIDYYSTIDGLYFATHFVDVDDPRSYDVSQCDEAVVTVTDPTDPLVDELTPDEPSQDPLAPGLDPAPDAAAPDPDLEVPIPQFDS